MRFPTLRPVIFEVIIAGAIFGLVTYPAIRASITGKNATMTVVGKTVVPVHCYATLANAVAAGKYHEVNQYVDEDDFPLHHVACKESQEVMYFVKFDENMPRDEAIKRLGMAGFRPADLYELLAFGESQGTDYRDSTVVALGSAMRNMDLSPYLYGGQGDRDVGLHGDGECDLFGCNEFLSFGYKWHAGDLFLAVHI